MNRIIHKLQTMWRRTPFGRIKKDEDALRWGIVGTGYMAHVFSDTIANSRRNVISSVVSRSLDKAHKFAKAYNAEYCYTSLSDFAKDAKFDIAYIATPAECHYQDIKVCLEAGCNVLCEKPITLSKEHLLSLIAIGKQNDCFLMEGMWMRCLPTFSFADEWIAHGRIGNVIGIRANLFKMESAKSEDLIKSVMGDYGEYAIAFALKYMNNPRIENFTRLNNSVGVDADWQIALADKQSIGIINMSSRFRSASNASVIGKKGVIEWETQFNRSNKITLYDNNGKIVESKQFKYINDGFEYELEEVNRCLIEGRDESILVPLDVSLSAVELIEKLMS